MKASISDRLALSPLIKTHGYSVPDLEHLLWIPIQPDLIMPNLTVSVERSSEESQNWLLLPKEFRWRENTLLRVLGGASRNLIIIGANSNLYGTFQLLGNGNTCIFGESIKQTSRVSCWVWSQNSLLFWGAGATSNGTTVNIQGNKESVVIGDDCMFAKDTDIRNSDQHAIADFETGEWVNPPSSVIIEPHVWLAEKSVVMKGVSIGSGSVIGHGSVVTASVKRNSVAVGSPARVVKSKVTWFREPSPPAGGLEKIRAFQTQLEPEASVDDVRP